MKPEIKNGVATLNFESGLKVHIKDDGQVAVNGIVVSDAEFIEIAAIRHKLKQG